MKEPEIKHMGYIFSPEWKEEIKQAIREASALATITGRDPVNIIGAVIKMVQDSCKEATHLIVEELYTATGEGEAHAKAHDNMHERLESIADGGIVSVLRIGNASLDIAHGKTEAEAEAPFIEQDKKAGISDTVTTDLPMAERARKVTKEILAKLPDSDKKIDG